MNAPSHVLRLSVVLISLATVAAAQSKNEQAASLDIRIDSDHASIHQMEALPVQLTFVNTGSEPIGVSREIFLGAWKDYGLRMKRPVKKEGAVTSEDHFVAAIQAFASSNAGSRDWVAIPVGKSEVFRLVLSFDFGHQKPLFLEPGSYSFHLEWVAVGGAVRKTNELKLEVTPANNVTETRQLLAVAETCAESINNPATFRLDKELEATKARIASLKQRVEGPPQR